MDGKAFKCTKKQGSNMMGCKTSEEDSSCHKEWPWRWRDEDGFELYFRGLTCSLADGLDLGFEGKGKTTNDSSF